jgi:hypothetical protein
MNKARKTRKTRKQRKTKGGKSEEDTIIKNNRTRAIKRADKLRKKINNPETFKKCEDFCRNDYTVKFYKQAEEFNKEVAKDLKIPYKKRIPTKEEQDYIVNGCILGYCNPTCSEMNPEFYKKNLIKNGFYKKYTKQEIKKLREKGALSGCFFNDYKP